ncbi:hematopoietic progenitor cell antigen CD34 isoform X2 [Salmo salar]|uniref:Hematopoietic progenitor cell antigen CD34 isoform X2 n=1 Tax=Salmo salar TaxID=8030 RepID=A0A1S3P3P8_SALSA|nr:hematopoietic progenitor cell antigen CD34 isoform X2 [Salmo salar]|eukprot:XP_014022176.1 PREDICTED: hematopoietic progenitor cell antigen CD34 isoform X2 [Salmo salar]
MNETHKMIAFALLFIATLLHGRVVAEYEVVTGPTRPVNDAGVIRGDDIDTTQLSDEADTPFVQTIVFPSIPGLDLSYISDILDDTTAAPVTEVVEETMREATEKAGEAATTDDDQETQAPQQILTYQSSDIVLIPEAGVMCVDKEAAQDRDAVSLKLKASSSCEETRSKIESVLEHLCGVDCKLEVFQEDNSNEILIFGQYIEADAQGMAEKFNNDNIKDKIDFEEAVPRWEKNSKLVLVSLLLTGLLLAILLIAGYYLKTHRPPPKGARLAEEGFQVDEENQANTLVSVAPLQPQEPLDKTPTNGHSATQTPVADTEM